MTSLNAALKQCLKVAMKYLGQPITQPTYMPPLTAWAEHGPFIMWLLRKTKPTTLVELGSHYGFSYFAMCETVLREGLLTRCFAVDTWAGDQHAGFYDNSVYESVVAENAQYESFSKLLRCTFNEALSEIKDGSVDLLHVDGRHYYDDVKEDFESWIPKLSKRAIVLFHDTTVFERDFGVHQYWSEICDTCPSINLHHGHGLGILFWGEKQSVGAKEIIKNLKSSNDREVFEGIFAANGSAFEVRSLYSRKIDELTASIEREVQTNARCSTLQEETRRTSEELNTALTSLSWRITRPLRLIRRVLGGDFGALRGVHHALPAFINVPAVKLRNKFRNLPQRLATSPANKTAFNQMMDHATQATELPSPMNAQLSDPELLTIDLSAVTHNSAKWLSDFAASLKALDYPPEKINICFVDNASTDDTPKRLGEIIAELEKAGFAARLIEQANVGFGGGHNAGIASGDNPFVLVTNVDLVFEPDSLRRLVSHALSDTDKAAAWEMRQKPYEHPKLYEPLTGTTNWNSHACVLMRRDAFTNVGGYSDDLFMYGEDVELSYRFRANGYQLRFSPHAVVNHYSYETTDEIKPLQYTGSIFANLYIRLMYGTLRDIFVVPALLTWLIVGKERFPSARKQNLRNVVKLIKIAPKALRANFALKTKAAFPFHVWDYDFVRDGSFHEAVPALTSPPKVTVITRSYKGREQLLRQALISVANQTYSNIEHLISEDQDDTFKPLVSEFNKRSVHTITHISGAEHGRSVAGNRALERATGEYCIFLDDDDQFYCDHIETLVAAVLASEDTRGSYSLAFDVSGKRLSKTGAEFDNSLPVTHAYMKTELDSEEMKRRNLWPIQAVLFERSLFVERGGFEEDLEMLEDWVLWQKYSHDVEFAYVPKTTSFYRTPLSSQDSASRMATLNNNYEDIVVRMNRWRNLWDKGKKRIQAAVAEPKSEIKLLFPIGHFYSPIADPIDIAARKDRIFNTKENNVGIDFNEKGQLALLPKLKKHVDTIDYPINDPGDGLTYFYENDQFPVLDAEFLYAALCHFKPKNMIEIGSGYSSLITADVNRRLLKDKLNFICVEPFPRQFLIDGVEGISHLEISKVEDLPLSYFEKLGKNDILFIDSSHVSKVGSDVNYLFFEVIPRLKSGVIVHVHDIFLPDDYPETWALDQNRNWNEQYLLHGFLQFNSEWKIIWASHMMGTRHSAEVQSVFSRYPKLGGGGSIWIQRA